MWCLVGVVLNDSIVSEQRAMSTFCMEGVPATRVVQRAKSTDRKLLHSSWKSLRKI